MKIYHNPRCRKSREGLAILEATNLPFETIKYLENPISKEELGDIIDKLGISPIALVRKNEAIWKSDFKNKNLSDEDIIQAMVAHPKLIERPIVVNKDKAVIGRPPERISKIL